jgi:hypothetical protein
MFHFIWSQFSEIFDNFLRQKFAFFSKTNVMIKCFQLFIILALFWVKNSNFLFKCFGESIFKIITSVPEVYWKNDQNVAKKTLNPGANPTVVSYNASVVKIYNATSGLYR